LLQSPDTMDFIRDALNQLSKWLNQLIPRTPINLAPQYCLLWQREFYQCTGPIHHRVYSFIPLAKLFTLLYLFKAIHTFFNIDAPKAYSPPPPKATYPNLSLVIAAISKHAKANRYTLFKRNTRPTKIVFTYNRFGKLQQRDNTIIYNLKKRKGSRSKKCNCRIKLALKLDSISGHWQVNILKGVHNYKSSADPSAHPTYRIATLDSQIHTKIKALASTGLNTK
jgi:hypothetical protein